MRRSRLCEQHSSYAWASEIKAPTLAIGGVEEGLFVGGQQEALAAAIPGAELVLLKDAVHMFFMEQVEEASRYMVRFLSGAS